MPKAVWVRTLFFIVTVATTVAATYAAVWYPELSPLKVRNFWALLGLIILMLAIASMIYVIRHPTWWGTLLAFALGVGAARFAWPTLSATPWRDLLLIAVVLAAGALLWALTVGHNPIKGSWRRPTITNHSAS